MSFQLNLLALTESARDRLSRLDTSSASFHDRFRSPHPALLRWLVSSNLLSLFEMTPDLLSSLCLGIVGNGLKFCTLGATQCTFTTHTKKVKVSTDTLYIASSRNSAFTHHFIGVGLLSADQRDAVLQECHSKEEWAHLFHIWKANAVTDTEMGAQTYAPVSSGVLMSTIKPVKRFRSDMVSESSLSDRDNLASFSLDSDVEIIDIPADDLKDLPQEEAFARILLYWDDLTSNVNKFGSLIRRLQGSLYRNMDSLDGRIDSVDAHLGICSRPSLADSCITAWDGISYVEDMINNLNSSFTEFKQAHEAARSDGQNSLQVQSTRLDDFMQEVGKGFTDLSAFVKILNDEQISLNQVIRSLSSPPATGGWTTTMTQDLNDLKEKVAQLKASPGNLRNMSSTNALLPAGDIKSIKIQLKLLESPSHA
jgi:hypothetical protein